MFAYMLLAEKAASLHRPLWPVKPEFHVPRMQAESQTLSIEQCCFMYPLRDQS